MRLQVLSAQRKKTSEQISTILVSLRLLCLKLTGCRYVTRLYADSTFLLPSCGISVQHFGEIPQFGVNRDRKVNRDKKDQRLQTSKIKEGLLILKQFDLCIIRTIVGSQSETFNLIFNIKIIVCFCPYSPSCPYSPQTTVCIK